MKPVIAIVGRPNVGKSTLFNRLTRSRAALVADFPGLTRDRHYGDGRVGPCDYIVIDTGGFEPLHAEGVARAMAAQAEQAIAESDAVLFVLDAREGLTAQDRRIAERLRVAGRPVLLAVNKAEGLQPEALRSFMNSDSVSRIRSLQRTARACATSWISRSRRSPSRQGGHRHGDRRRPAAGARRRSRPSERWQVDADQRAARRGAPDCLRRTRHDARCDRGRIRVRRPAVHADRYRRPAPRAARCSRRSRSSPSSRRCRRSTDANVVVLLLDARAGDRRAGRAYRRLHPRKPVVRW